MEYRLNFLLTEGEHGWTGRCLEYHFVTQANTFNGLVFELQRTMVGHMVVGNMAGNEPFQGLERAPEQYWDQFRKAKAVVTLRDGSPILRQRNLSLPEVNEMRIAETLT